MSLKKCGIIFNNRSPNVYYSGETVSGFVNLFLDRKRKCEGIWMKVSGEAKCQWTETGGNGQTKRPTDFSGKETYFDYNMQLIPSADEPIGLMAGNHEFNFSFTLPQHLPSSFEGPFGYVRYVAKVEFKRPKKISLFYKVSFMVLDNIDLNHIPNTRTPIKHVAHKDFHFFMKSMGYIKASLEISTTGFVPGNSLRIKCYLENKSKVNMSEIKFSLVKISIYKTTCPFNNIKEEINTIAQCKSIGVDKEEDKYLLSSLLIPATPPSSFMSCSYIETKYELKVNVVASTVHGNLKFSVPVIIGTVPLNSCEIQSTTSQDLDAPPPYNDIAFPTFEEAFVEKRVKEDYEEWDHSPNFTPTYPVYRSKTEETIEIDERPPANAPSMIDNLFDSVKKSDIYKSLNKNF